MPPKPQGKALKKVTETDPCGKKPSSARVPPLSLSLGSQTIKLVIGKKRKEFVVHKKLLCESSKYFKERVREHEMLLITAKDGGQLYLLDAEPRAVTLYIDWMYRGKLPSAPVDGEKEFVGSLFDLYIFAGRIGLPDDSLQCETMNLIQDLSAEHDIIVDNELTLKVHQNTVEGSYLLDYCIDCLNFVYMRECIAVQEAHRAGREVEVDKLDASCNGLHELTRGRIDIFKLMLGRMFLDAQVPGPLVDPRCIKGCYTSAGAQE